MKIAFIYDTAFPWVTGGAERRIYEISTRLSNRGHDVHIFSLGYWMNTKEFSSQKTIKYNGITYHSVGKPMDLYTKNNTRSIKEALYFARCILTNAKLKEFDIVDCQGFPYFSCYTSKIKHRKNLVITLHEVWNDYWYEYLGKLGIFGKIIEKGIFNLTKNFICVSQLTFENMLKNKCPENSTIIANGVNTQEITFINPSEEYKDIIFAGRLIPEKHVDLIINAISKVKKVHPQVKCKIIGNGPSETYLKSLTSSLDLENNIIFEDFYEDHEKLYSEIKSSSVLVLPSKREGFGIIVIEANACGVPVITLNDDMNAAKDLITNENGWLTNDDSEELAKLLNNIIEKGIDSYQRNLCREYAKEYDWNHIALLTENYYLDLLK
ncbi:MAG: glycosyltransferase family 4 protein [Methanosphaera sp.]|nr:glycosyltransferase family 4 protein [Methanosphaera sp.]